MRQEDHCKFEASLDYTATSRLYIIRPGFKGKISEDFRNFTPVTLHFTCAFFHVLHISQEHNVVQKESRRIHLHPTLNSCQLLLHTFRAHKQDRFCV